MNRKVVIFFFYIPFLFNVLNIQNLLVKFTPASSSQIQLFAYFNVCAVIAGSFLIMRYGKKLTTTSKAWLTFFVVYYLLAIVGNIVYRTEPYNFLAASIAVVYFAGFSILANIPSELKSLTKVVAYGFLGSCIVAIIFNYFQIDMDIGGIKDTTLSRAGGVYADSNNTAASALIALIFIQKVLIPKTRWQYILKWVALAIPIYTILIAFSKTGFVALTIVLLVLYINQIRARHILVGSFLFVVLFLFAGLSSKSTGLFDEVQQRRVESLVNLVTLNTDKVDFSNRDVLLQNMFNYIEEDPIIGRGFQFSNKIRGHNTLVGVWADSGIIAFLFFLGVLAYFYMKALQSDKSIRYFALALLVTFSIFMLTLQTVINQDYLMVVVAVLAVYIGNPNSADLDTNRIMREQQPEPHTEIRSGW